MTAYRCLALAADGKKSWQSVEATDQAACLSQLMAAGFTPLQIASGAPSLSERLNQPITFGRRGGSAEQALVMSQLAILVRSGLPVDLSLDLLREQAAKDRQRKLIAAILTNVRSGESLGGAMDKEGVFPKWSVGVVRAAGEGGELGKALTSVAERMTLAAETRAKLITSLTYPFAVLIASIVALVIVLTSVVPQFEPIFAGSEDQLPILTQRVLWLSGAIRAYGWTILAGAVLVPLCLIVYIRSETGAKSLSSVRRYIPGMKLRDQYLAAQFTGLFATLITNGVSAVRALPLVRETMGSRLWQSEMELVETQVSQGSRLSSALKQSSVFPDTASRLIEVGERTGKLGETCAHASHIMGSAATARIERIVSLVNPISIILLGGIVAMLVAGVMLGIFALGDFAA